MCVCEGLLLSYSFPENPERIEKARSSAGFGVAGYAPISKSYPDTLRVAINRLSLRIVRETGGQAVCDRLERELAALVEQSQ